MLPWYGKTAKMGSMVWNFLRCNEKRRLSPRGSWRGWRGRGGGRAWGHSPIGARESGLAWGAGLWENRAVG
jgi:hypothetical protein